MASFNKFYPFVNALATKQVNLHSDALNVMLTNTAPVDTYSAYSQLTDLGTGNGYTNGGSQATLSSDGETGGVYTLFLNNITFTATTGNIGPFRYAVLYDTANGVLIGYFDYGTNLTITAGNSFEVQFSTSTGVLQLQ